MKKTEVIKKSIQDSTGETPPDWLVSFIASMTPESATKKEITQEMNACNKDVVEIRKRMGLDRYDN